MPFQISCLKYSWLSYKIFKEYFLKKPLKWQHISKTNLICTAHTQIPNTTSVD